MREFKYQDRRTATNRQGWMHVPFLAVFILLFHGEVRAQDALEIIKKTDAKSRGDYSEQEMRMTIVRPDWTRSITMKSWTKGASYSLILITAPAKEKGQVFLKREKEMWNWVPSIERMIKIPPSMMMQSWMGSDFTNDDLVRESSVVIDYVHTLLGSENIDGADCWKLELIPKPDAPVVWGKVIVWIDKNYNQRKAEYYDEDGYPVSTMHLTEIRKMGDREIPTRMEMIPEGVEGKKTVIEILAAVYNKPIAESYFSIQNMKMIR
ncbi:MAG TPA: outer membrane lipoprotein-sorting protein [Cyclobacteriaceae bacterium]|nr:outer membrane lipoprotein-sorting protein [Cyclobacteriaceae bacterium]